MSRSRERNSSRGLVVGRRVMITAAGHGMGRAIALGMAAEGCRSLYLIDRDEHRLRAVAAELSGSGAQVLTQTLDLLQSRSSTRESVRRASDAMGGLDVLISHAGGSTPGLFLDMTDENLDRTIALNFVVGFTLAQEAARQMAAAGGGVILLTASAVDSGGFPEVPVYSAVKSALINLVKAVAPELAAHNIRINTVSPGLTDSRAEDGAPWPDEVARQMPMGRLGRPDEIADAFVFLASDHASYITGENLNVNGALTAKAHGVKWAAASPKGPHGAVSGRFPGDTT